MNSKWYHLKSSAVQMRKSGKSLPFIHKELGIPKSTLSYLFKNVTLSKRQKEQLYKKPSKELSLPITCFGQVNIDKRTVGKETYPHYKGVCGIRCGNVAIRRRLVFLAEKYFAIIGQPK
jgi:hypothetical protein